MLYEQWSTRSVTSLFSAGKKPSGRIGPAVNPTLDGGSRCWMDIYKDGHRPEEIR